MQPLPLPPSQSILVAHSGLRWGSSSGTCFSSGCGSSGWIDSNFLIVLDGNYYLEVGVTNWLDDTYDSGLAVDGVTVAGTSLLAGPTSEGTTPEPSSLILLGTGLLAAAGTMLGSSQRKLHPVARSRPRNVEKLGGWTAPTHRQEHREIMF